MFTLQGHVTNEINGKSIVGAIVKAQKKLPPEVEMEAEVLTFVALEKPEVYETKTDENGSYIMEIPTGYYIVTIGAENFSKKKGKNECKRDNQTVQFDTKLKPLNVGKLEGKVIAINLNGITIGGFKMMISKDDKKIYETPVGSDGSYFFEPLTSGDYILSIVEPEKRFLKPSQVKATITTKDEKVTIQRNVSVEIMTVPNAVLGLEKKKVRFWGGGGQVDEGHCSLARINPSKTDKVVPHSTANPDTSKDSKYGWFKFQDLVPGVYAVTFFKPTADGKGLKKYSKQFKIGKNELEKHQSTPYQIGKTALQKSWTDMDEIADQIEKISNMVKSITGIFDSLGLKIQLGTYPKPPEDDEQ